MLKGLILVGGRSRRMGRDKAFIDYHGKPQWEHIQDLMKAAGLEVWVSCRAEQAPLFEKKASLILDEKPDCGPMGGLISAFNVFPKSAFLLLACDMPMVNQDSISHLIQNRGSDAMATTYTEADFPQPTFCIFEYACNSILNDNFRNENYSLSSILKKIKYKAIAPVDPEILTNINHPDSRF